MLTRRRWIPLPPGARGRLTNPINFYRFYRPVFAVLPVIARIAVFLPVFAFNVAVHAATANSLDHCLSPGIILQFRRVWCPDRICRYWCAWSAESDCLHWSSSILGHWAWLLSFLQGVDSSAVGLDSTAMFKHLADRMLEGSRAKCEPLRTCSWLGAITRTAFVGSAWFGLSPPVALLLGGAIGVPKWAAIDRWQILARFRIEIISLQADDVEESRNQRH